MSIFIGKTKSSRHGIIFESIPTMKGPRFGSSIPRYTSSDYSAILDCVYEMAGMITSSNGVSIDQAIQQVLSDEKWSILPSHKKLIATMLQE